METAKKLAALYPQANRAQYTAAAASLRLPYWDWAASQSVPQATVPTKMSVRIPNGSSLQTVQIDNPLYTYKFPSSALSGTFGPFDSQNRAQIYRCTSGSYPGSANSLLSQQPYKQWVVCMMHTVLKNDTKLTQTFSMTPSPIQQHSESLLQHQVPVLVLSRSITTSTGMVHVEGSSLMQTLLDLTHCCKCATSIVGSTADNMKYAASCEH